MKARGCRKCTAMHGWPGSVPPRWGRLDPAASCAASRCVHQVVQLWLEGPPQGVACRMSRAPAAQAAGRYSRGAMLPRPAAVSVRQPRIAQRRWGAQWHQRLQLAAVSGLSCAGGCCVGRLGGAQAGGGVRKLMAWAICMFSPRAAASSSLLLSPPSAWYPWEGGVWCTLQVRSPRGRTGAAGSQAVAMGQCKGAAVGLRVQPPFRSCILAPCCAGGASGL